MTRRDLPPIPVDTLVRHPRALALPAAGYGMLARLVLHFWATECRLLPETDAGRQAIARADGRSWARYRDDINAVLAAILPEMRAAREARESRRDRLRIATHASVAARTRKRVQANLAGAADAAALAQTWTPAVDRNARARAEARPPAPVNRPRGPLFVDTGRRR